MDVVLVQFAELSQPAFDDQPAADGSSRNRAITIPGSPELGPTSESEPNGAGQPESIVGDPAPRPLQVILPSDQGEKRPSKSKFTRSGLPRPTRPVEVLTLNYLPPRGPEPPRVEISAPRVEEAKDILRRWEPFHSEASAADRMNNLFPHIYRVPVITHGMGFHEDYSVNLPTSTLKEDFQQIVDNGIQVQNRNFVQSTELVRYVVPPSGFIVITYLLYF